MAKPNPRCVRCNKSMRNDGTAEQPKWECNNPKCVRYVPEDEENNTNETEENNHES